MVQPTTADRPMHVLAELHAPGLDLNQRRWTHHTVFMSEVRGHLHELSVQALAGYEVHGRGAVLVDAEQWLRLVRHPFDTRDGEVAVPYLPASQATERIDFGPLQGGFGGLLGSYDPACEFLLVVEHQPVQLLSCYVMPVVAGAPPCEVVQTRVAGQRENVLA